MDFSDQVPQDIDVAFIKSRMDRMDVDIAIRFIFSGVSLSKTKIEDAFVLACREMALREEAKSKKLLDQDKAEKDKVETMSTKSLVKLFEDILLASTKKAK